LITVLTSILSQPPKISKKLGNISEKNKDFPFANPKIAGI
jgi:hypothetical protein